MIGILYFTLITFVLSIIIVFLNNFLFKRKSKVDLLTELLPGYNCGACGFGSCGGMASELIEDSKAIKKCRLIKNKEEIMKFLKEN